MNKTLIRIIIGAVILAVLLFVLALSFDDSKQETINEDELFVFPPFSQIYKDKEIEFDITKIENNKDKTKFDKNLKSKLLESANMMTPPDKSPDITVISETDKGKYIEQKLSLKIYPATIAYAYLLTPKNIEFPAPAVIAMHGHGNEYTFGKDWVVGNKGTEESFYGKELAERGYIVFAMDAPLFGDRLFTGKNENSPNTLEQFGAQSLLILGHSLLGETIREDISSLNFLTSLKNVNENKIGCIGHSLGGIRCMYLSALDNRISSVVLSNSVSSLKRDYNKGILHSWFGFIPGSGSYTETDGILALINPRPLMILYSENDPVFPKDEAEKQIKNINDLYTKLEDKDNFISLYIPKQAHTFPKEFRNESYNFFDKTLKNL